MKWMEKLNENIKKTVRSWLNVLPANPFNFQINEMMDFEGHAILNRIWYRGDGNELEQIYRQNAEFADRHKFWASKSTPGMDIRKIHTGLPGLTVKVLSFVVLPDMNDFEFENPSQEELWKKIEKDNKFHKKIESALKETLFIGDGAFKVTVDTTISEYPILEWYPGDRVEFVYQRDRIREIVFKTPYKEKILIDDVWSGGSSKDGKYPLMSSAIAAGLYHPRCKDSHTTYFPGITKVDPKYNKQEIADLEEQAQQESRQQHAERQEKRFGRLAEFSLNPENQQRYEQKQKEWKHVRMKTGGLDSREYADFKDSERTQGFEDITDEWKKTATPNSHDIEEMRKYKIKDSVYTVDGKNVLLDYSDKERRIAELLKEELGGEISMVPRVLNPQGISTPDYIFRDEAFDLKELSGTSKNLVYNAIAKKKRQASNFILDISKSPLEESEIARQIEDIYWSRHTMFVEKIIVVKDEKIRKIYKRNREK